MKGPPFGGPFRPNLGGLARFPSRDERPRSNEGPCHELGPPRLAALEGLAVAPLVRADREEADDDHPERNTRHETDREEHHRVSSFFSFAFGRPVWRRLSKPRATALASPPTPHHHAREPYRMSAGKPSVFGVAQRVAADHRST